MDDLHLLIIKPLIVLFHELQNPMFLQINAIHHSFLLLFHPVPISVPRQVVEQQFISIFSSYPTFYDQL